MEYIIVVTCVCTVSCLWMLLDLLRDIANELHAIKLELYKR